MCLFCWATAAAVVALLFIWAPRRQATRHPPFVRCSDEDCFDCTTPLDSRGKP